MIAATAATYYTITNDTIEDARDLSIPLLLMKVLGAFTDNKIYYYDKMNI